MHILLYDHSSYNLIDITNKRSKEILRKYKQYRYKGNPLLVSGNTELFSVDIFNLPQEV